MRTKPLLLGALACATAATAAHAQVTADAMTRGSPQRRVSFGATASAEWDNNVNQSTGTTGLVTKPEGDWIFTPSVHADVVQPIGRQAVFLRGSLGYTFYDENEELNSSRINLDGGVGGKFGPCGLVAIGGYTRGRVLVDDRFLAASVTNILETKRIGVSATCVRPPGIGIQLSTSKEWGDNSQATRTTNDFESTNASAGLVFGRPSVASFSLVGSYGRTEYPDRPQALGQGGGYETVSAGISAERRLGARINANIGINYTKVNLLDDQLVPGLPALQIGKFEGTTYQGALTYRVSTRFTTGVNVSRQVSPTLVQAQSYEVQTSYGANATYRLGTRISLSASANRSKSDTKGIVSLIPGALTEATTNSFGGSLTYQQSRRLSFSLSGRYSDRNSDAALYEFDRTRVGLTANFTY